MSDQPPSDRPHDARQLDTCHDACIQTRRSRTNSIRTQSLHSVEERRMGQGRASWVGHGQQPRAQWAPGCSTLANIHGTYGQEICQCKRHPGSSRDEPRRCFTHGGISVCVPPSSCSPTYGGAFPNLISSQSCGPTHGGNYFPLEQPRLAHSFSSCSSTHGDNFSLLSATSS